MTAARELADSPIADAVTVSREDALAEDAYWARRFTGERYYTPGLEYEDYAPAYCVGYIGYAQYGGSYDDAETSLCANWERIKGDSRLSIDEARLAMRAAWDRMAGRPKPRTAKHYVNLQLMRQRLSVPSFKLGSLSLR
jgi:hypothetical protein